MKTTTVKNDHGSSQNEVGVPTLVRELGKLEQSMWFFEHSSPANICVGCEVNGVVTDEHLREAVSWCQIRYPMLRSVVTQVKKKLYFSCYAVGEAPEIEIDLGDCKLDDEDRVVEQVLGQRLCSEGGLMMRVKHIRVEENRSFLCVYFSHLIGDGFSGVLLMRDLLSVLGHHCSATPIPKAEPTDFPLAAEDGIAAEHSGFKGFKKFFKFQKIFLAKVKELGGHPSPLQMKNTGSLPERKTHIRSLTLTSSETEALIQRAKDEGVTFYALLSAITLDATYPFLVSDPKLKSISSRIISFASPVDLRPFLSISAKEQFGFFAASINHLYRLEEANDLVKLAKQVQSDVKSSLFKMKHHLHLTSYVAKFLGWRWLFPASDKGIRRTAKMTDKMFKSCSANLTFISNPPVEPNIGGLKIERARGHISPSIMGVAFYSAVLYNKVLTVYLNYNNDQFADEDAEQLNVRWRENAQALIQGQSIRSGTE